MYIINSIIYSFIFIFCIHIILFKFNLRNYFKKPKIVGRWSDNPAYLIGGIIFIFFLIYYFILSFFKYTIFFLNFYELFILFIFFLIGLYDDKYNLNGKIKLIIYFFLILGLNFYYLNNQYFFIILSSIFISFGIFISLNIIDNMDGIFSSFFLLLICYLMSLIYYQMNISLISGFISIILINIYFLIINLFKDKSYLGDSGSYLLSSLIIIIFLKYKDLIDLNPTYLSYLVVLLITFAYPIFDFIYVCSIRIYNKKSPFIGGIDHTSHIISKYFNSDSKSLIFIGVTNFIYFLINYYFIINNFNYFYNIYTFILFNLFLSTLIFIFNSKRI